MSQKYSNLLVPVGENLEEHLRRLSPNFVDYRVLRQSIDARGRRPTWVYSVDIYGEGESPCEHPIRLGQVSIPKVFRPPIIVGAGPAGLFAALRLVERGIPCLLVEQGSPATERMKSIARFWRYGELDPNTNVCFGEGGAGLYSDGKLMTRIKSPYTPYVLDRLVQFGAPEEVRWVANPHVGSDRIRRIIPKLRAFLLENGCEILFNTKVSGLWSNKNCVKGVQLSDGRKLESDQVILAIGHSATEMFYHLHSQGVAMEGKSFAVGLRIEHPQASIDKCQYGRYAGHPSLGAASYRLSDHDPKLGVGVYSFCMCPGGYVISSSTETGRVVSNGMSNYARNSPFANAAIVISLDFEKHFGRDLFGGLNFRNELEERAHSLVRLASGSKQFPAQRAIDFVNGKGGPVGASSSPSGVVPARLDQVFDKALRNRLAASLSNFDRKMRGFLSREALLHGVESRTSCPIRIPRDSVSLQSISHCGLYPAGEGAGYAGGITSAAVDGVRIAESIAKEYGG